jgi:fatty-acyl-CoA synthase
LLFRGGTVVLVESFDAEGHLSMLARHGVTVTFGVPTQLAMLRESRKWGMPLPTLRWFISGGAPCAQRIRRDVREAGYRFREGYGLTECGPNCFATSDDIALSREGTVGWPVPFLEMRLQGDDGSDADAGEIGELQLRGPQVFSGYFRAPRQSAEAFTDDGWLRTGDLASRDGDGVYSVRGRRKEMFISGGENVFPGEVEAALLDCPGVAEACVVGVADPRWGEVGCAVVVRRDGALAADTLLVHARAKLAGYKVPKRVRFVHAIPRLGSGKVDRAALARLIDEP